jgi:GH24 family phage-related lysozyme (muramidase)
VTKLPVKLSDLFRYYKALPHQMAAIVELEAVLLKVAPDAFNREQLWFKTWSQAGKQPDHPLWFEPARKIVAEFEGCRLTPYLCAAGVPTQGYGRTGKGITLASAPISQAQADKWLAEDLQHFADGIHRLLPGSHLWGATQQAALISWAFNVGLGAVETSTLRKRLLAGEPGIIVVPQELPKWNKANGAVLVGLARRRAAEVALFTGTAPAAPPLAPLPMQQGVLLNVPYEAQNDNASGTGYRECFSSSAAMVARYYGKITSDDAYNKFRAKYGDTTDSTAQVSALKALGLNARFITNCTAAQLQAELDAGRPVLVGWLHKGPVSAPTGGGHWSVVIGYTPTAFIHNDPYGQANLTAGGYLNTTKGKAVTYNRSTWLKRWLVEGANSGWALLVSR